MRIPRLIKKSITDNRLSLIFDTGEERYFDVKALLRELTESGVHTFTIHDLEYSVIQDGIMVFPSVKVSLPTPQGKQEMAYDLDPDYVYQNSIPTEISIGERFKAIRKAKKFSQDKVAERCKTSKSYISKFENNKLQIEWNSIRRLFFMGLDVKINAASIQVDAAHTSSRIRPTRKKSKRRISKKAGVSKSI